MNGRSHLLEGLTARVERRSRRTLSTDSEIFRRHIDDVVIYFFNSDFKFFEDASKFSVTSLYDVMVALCNRADHYIFAL